MSVKYFCDCCGKELDRNYVSARYKPAVLIEKCRVQLEVQVAVNGTWNAGYICLDCLRVAFGGSETEFVSSNPYAEQETMAFLRKVQRIVDHPDPEKED